MTKECIDSIRHFNYETPIVVVDNLGTFSHPEAKVIRGENWGFAKSCNRAAKEIAGDLLFLNNDTYALNDFPYYMERLLDDQTGVVGALLLYPNDTIQHCGSRYNGGKPDHPHKGEHFNTFPQALTNREVEGVTFACALVNRKCWDELGGFDEVKFPFGYEDIDFCLRARMKNFHIYCCGEARLVHKEHATQRRFLKEVRKQSDISIVNLRKRWG